MSQKQYWNRNEHKNIFFFPIIFFHAFPCFELFFPENIDFFPVRLEKWFLLLISWTHTYTHLDSTDLKKKHNFSVLNESGKEKNVNMPCFESGRKKKNVYFESGKKKMYILKVGKKKMYVWSK